jgi:exosortase
MKAETARRLGFALAVGAAFAASPLTSGRRILPSLVGGAVAAGAVLAFRRPREPLSFRLSAPTRASRLMLAATIAAAGVAFAPVLIDLFHEYTQSIWKNAHGLLFPFLIWEVASARLRRTQGEADSSAWGFAPALLGLLLVVFDSGMGTLQGATVGMVLFAWGSSLLVLGSRRTRALALPLALCLFLVPLSTSLAAPIGLPSLSASGAAWLLELSGTPVLHVGRYLVMTDTFAYGVSNNCSGFSTFVAALAVASFLAAHTKSRTRVLLLLAAPWPLVIAANSIRSAALITTGKRFAVRIMDTPLDGISGIATFWLVMGVLFLIADRDGLREGLR